MSIFTLKKEKDIIRQIEHFVHHASKRSFYTAQNKREWLLSYVKVTQVESLFDINEDNKGEFLHWVSERFNGSVACRNSAEDAIDGFARFYKHDIM